MAHKGNINFVRDFWEAGESKKYQVYEVDKRELKVGIEIEMEHTTDPRVARKIALDHLAEFPTYYTALLKMEARLRKGK